MKKVFKIVFAIFSLGVIALVGLHFFLQYGLTKTMRNVILPRVEKETGIHTTIQNLSINLLKGTLNLQDVAIKNPKGFVLEDAVKIDHVLIRIDFWTLLTTDRIKIEDIEIKNALLNVIRNTRGEINLTQFQKIKPSFVESAPQQSAPNEKTPPLEQTKKPLPVAKKEEQLPEILIQSVHINTTVKYLDFKLNELDLSLQLRLIGDHISTLKDPNARWGNLFLTGSAGSKQTRFVTNLKIKLAPISNPDLLSFDLSGTVMQIDQRILDKLYKKLRIKSIPFGINPDIYVRENRFAHSKLNFELKDIVLRHHSGKEAMRIDRLALPIPVEGTLKNPKIDFQQALKTAMTSNSQSILKSFLQKELGSEKVPQDITDASVDLLGKKIDAIGKNEALKKLIKKAANQDSISNVQAVVTTDSLVDIASGAIDKKKKHTEATKALKELIHSQKKSKTNAPPEKTAKKLINIIDEELDKDKKHKKYKDDIKAIGNLLFGH